MRMRMFVNFMILAVLLLCGCIGIPLPTQTVAIEAYNEKGEFIPYEELKVLVFSVPRRRSYGGVLYQPVKVLSVKPNGLIEDMPKFSGDLACDIFVLVFTKASYLVNIGTIVSDACGPFQLIKTYNKEGTNYNYPHRLIAVCLPTKDSDSTIFRQIVPSEWRTTILQAKGYSFFLDKGIKHLFTLESLLCPTKTQEAYLSQYNFWEEHVLTRDNKFLKLHLFTISKSNTFCRMVCRVFYEGKDALLQNFV